MNFFRSLRFGLLQVDALTDRTFTFNQLSKMVRNVASGLVKIGLKPGDIVTIHSPNCMEYPVIYLAIQEVGAIASPVNPVYTASKMHLFQFISLCTVKYLM